LSPPSSLSLCPSTHLSPKPDPSTLVFGKQFSDHMLTIYWSEKGGWEAPQIKPFQNLSIHPATSALHYSVQVSANKANERLYLHNNCRLILIRYESVVNLCSLSLPQLFDKNELVQCIKKLIEVDQEWVPYSSDASLYIRPTFIGMEKGTGVLPYFPSNSVAAKPVKLSLSQTMFIYTDFSFKNCSFGNYGPTIAIQAEALKQGCQQVLWLYGEEEEITEVGTMNLFIYWTTENGGELRLCILSFFLNDLCVFQGEFKVTERKVGMKEFLDALKGGRVREVFGAGTACVVCPVGSLLYKGQVNQSLLTLSTSNVSVIFN
uniref:branched-chain-amino-acid transaminase n=1 Tax=Astyanax mexicanus TaxID=7994 RepID=A0A8B9JFQ5_ASTMX